MNVEQAIKTLNILLITADEKTVEGQALKRDIPIAIQALERQMAKQPIKEYMGNQIAFKCPNCRSINVSKFCMDCRQNLDWR